MTILDFLIILIGVLIIFLGHFQIGWGIIAILIAIILVRIIRGERVP